MFIGQEELGHFKTVRNLLYQCEKYIFQLNQASGRHFEKIHTILRKFDSLEYDITNDIPLLIKAINEESVIHQLQANFSQRYSMVLSNNEANHILSKNLLQGSAFEFILANLQYSDAYISALRKTQSCAGIIAD